MRNPVYPEFCSHMVLLDGSDDRSNCGAQLVGGTSRKIYFEMVFCWMDQVTEATAEPSFYTNRVAADSRFVSGCGLQTPGLGDTSLFCRFVVRSALFWLVIEIGAAPHLWVFSIKRKFYSKLRISFSDEMWKLSYWMCYSEYLMLYSLWDCCFIDSLPPLCDDFLLGYHRLKLFCRGPSHQNSLCDDFLLGYCLLKLFCWVRW